MLYCNYKEKSLKGRFIPYGKICPLLEKYDAFKEEYIGYSVGNVPINTLKIGNGELKILAWSQMHGNETTSTKAIFDLLNYYSKEGFPANASLYIIPMLNPDGANNFTRVNGRNIDLNRNAFEATEPEMQYLRMAYEKIRPNFCLNLHDQRTIFGFEETLTPATLSFLAPAYNAERQINNVRRKAMAVIAHVAGKLSKYIPSSIGRFDDSFNINCAGDFFTAAGTPTILFEAGHFPNDYEREKTREYFFFSLLETINYICEDKYNEANFEGYFSLPENKKIYCDVLVTNVNGVKHPFQYKEVLKNNNVLFKLEKLEIAPDTKVLAGHTCVLLNDIFGKSINTDACDFEEILLNKLSEIYNFQEKIA